MARLGFLLPAALLFGACASQHLVKYRKADTLSPSGPEAPIGAREQQPTDPTTSKQATIYSVGPQTYRFLLKDQMVWNAALNVLMRNYNINIVDRSSGIVTTEWDSFYLSGKIYRNKISVRIEKKSWGQSNVTIHNNVEVLKDDPAISSVWLPAEDTQGESARVIQNMALVLRQPPPILPTGTAVAKGQGTGQKSSSLQ